MTPLNLSLGSLSEIKVETEAQEDTYLSSPGQDMVYPLLNSHCLGSSLSSKGFNKLVVLCETFLGVCWLAPSFPLVLLLA